MAIIEHQTIIHARRETVWAISRDYSIRNLWDSFSHHTELENPNLPISIGSRVSVHANNGLHMLVEYVQFSPPFVAAIVMLKGPAFLSGFAGSWRFIEKTDDITLARFRYFVKTQPWTLPLISEKLAARYFDRVVSQRLESLKRYCESKHGA